MAAAIAHRGPDAAGVWCDPAAGVALAQWLQERERQGHAIPALQDLRTPLLLRRRQKVRQKLLVFPRQAVFRRMT